MTVSTTTSRVSYAGNGSTTNFAVPFYFLADSDLVVIKTAQDGTQTTLVLSTDYTVSGAGVVSGGSVTLTAAPASSYTIVIYRDPAVTQTTDYQPNDPFPAETHERALDKLTMITQRLKDLVGRSFRLSDGDTTTASTTLPAPKSNNIIGWNETATGLQNVDPVTIATQVTTGTARADIFSGTGSQTAFTLASNPGSQSNLDVSISGVSQRPGIDYTWTSGTTLTFTIAPPSGANNILVRYWLGLPQGTSDSATALFIQSGSGAVMRIAQDKLRETVSVKDFGAVGNGVTDDTAAIQLALNSVAAYGTVVFPWGTYVISSQLNIPTNNITIRGPAKIIAKSGMQFEFMLSVSTKTGVVIRDLEFDANQANRVSSQTIRFCGIILTTPTDCSVINVTVRNTMGYSSVPAVGLGVSVGTRTKVDGCRFIDCGGTSGTNASDGVYTFGDQTIISNCVAINCTDTAFVLEASNYGLITGCTALNCSAGAGITNFTSNDKYGNVINGLVVRNWKATVTGGIQIGIPAASTGNLIDTIVSNVVMTADKASGYGVGSAINVRTIGTGRVKQLSIANCLIDGATSYGVLVDGDVVSVTGCRIKNTVDPCVGVNTGYEHYISGNYLYGGSFAIATTGTSSVVAQSNFCHNQTSWGIYAFDTSTINSTMNNVFGASFGYVGKDAGATLNLVGHLANVLSVNNAAGAATSGSIVNKFVVTDRNGSPLGYVPVYNV